MKILVYGGRDFGKLAGLTVKESDYYKQKLREYKFIMEVLHKITVKYSKNFNPDDNWLPTDIEIISGMAPGADSVAVDFATIHYCSLRQFPADWQKYKKRAGFIRNFQMLTEGKPDLGVAFPGNKGTAMMTKLLKDAGIPVEEFTLPSVVPPSQDTSGPAQS